MAMFYNLIDNAIKYSEPGQTVTVQVEADSRNISCRITDMGPGIPSEIKEKLFKRFHRGNYSRPGVGLGLSIARQIAKIHLGSLDIDPSITNGSSFIFQIKKV